MLIQEVHNFFSPISAVKIRVWKRPSETHMLMDHHLERHHLPHSYLPPLQLVQRPGKSLWALHHSQDPSGLVPYADVAFDVGPERQGVATGRFLAHRVVWKPNRLGLGNLSQPSCWLTVFKRGRMLDCSGGLPFHKDIRSFLELSDHCKFLWFFAGGLDVASKCQSSNPTESDYCHSIRIEIFWSLLYNYIYASCLLVFWFADSLDGAVHLVFAIKGVWRSKPSLPSMSCMNTCSRLA